MVKCKSQSYLSDPNAHHDTSKKELELDRVKQSSSSIMAPRANSWNILLFYFILGKGVATIEYAKYTTILQEKSVDAKIIHEYNTVTNALTCGRLCSQITLCFGFLFWKKQTYCGLQDNSGIPGTTIDLSHKPGIAQYWQMVSVTLIFAI